MLDLIQPVKVNFQFRPDLEGTATTMRSALSPLNESSRPDLEGTVKRQVLGCGLRVVS